MTRSGKSKKSRVTKESKKILDFCFQGEISGADNSDISNLRNLVIDNSKSAGDLTNSDPISIRIENET